jgi:XTP/dITP diphosphohydrolase
MFYISHYVAKGIFKMKTIYFASANRGKTLEMQKLFSGLLKLEDLNDLGISATWEETGATFVENALIKARALKALIKKGSVIAEDSGLCVSALNGEPGVYSARWAGHAGDDDANNSKLLDKMKTVPEEKRHAHFVCSLVFINEKNKEFVFEGQLGGRILREPKGKGGFGYDSVFVPEGYDKTLAELSIEEKNKISHRARAVFELRKSLL